MKIFAVMRTGIAGVARFSAAFLLCSSFAGAQEPALTFLVVTDTHQTATADTGALQKLATSAAAMTPRPSFVIDTGDITESGRPEEYARFKEAIAPLNPAGIRFLAVPGNHDVRWSPQGKQGFEQAIGKLYQSFDEGGIHFVLLDSTVLLEHWGHFDQAELDWLGKDMKRVKAETPVMLFMHHWIGRDVPSVRPIDNEFALWPILRGHNVTAIFTGHGHSDLVWKTNGVDTFMSRGLYQGSYLRVSVTPLMAHVDRIVNQAPQPIHLVDISLPRRQKVSELRVAWDDPDVPFLARRRPAATLSPRAVLDNPDKETAQYRVDDGPWLPMTKDARDVWRQTFAVAPIVTGVHSADVRLTTSGGVGLTDELIFEVEHEVHDVARKWAVNLEGAIQSSPTLLGDTLYVTANDGRVSALNIANGKRRWSFVTHGPVTAAPLLANGVVYVGSGDHNLYALDASNGKERWRRDLGSPIFGSAAICHNMVCVGSDHHINGVDAGTGTVRWTQPAGSFFQSRAVADADTFYLGGWDNTLYALDALTGTPRWAHKMGRAGGGSGALSFYFSPAIASPAVSNGNAYVCTDDGQLHSLKVTDGSENWSVRAPQGGDTFGYSSPAVTGGQVYVAGLGSHGDVYAFDAGSGKLIWRNSTGMQIYNSSPRLAPDGRSLAIMSVRGLVSVLNTLNGARQWQYTLGPGNIFSTPEYDGHIVYTTTMANDVQAIAAPDNITPASR